MFASVKANQIFVCSEYLSQSKHVNDLRLQ